MLEENELNKIVKKEKQIFVDKNFLLIFLIAFLLVSILFVFAAPNIDFVNPTPDDGNLTTNDWVFINVSSSSSGNFSTFLDWNNTFGGWWNFNFTNSTGVFDNSSNSNFATFNGGLGISNVVNGVFGGALEFDGGDDYLLVANDSSLEPESLLTFSAWVKRANNDSSHSIFCKYENEAWASYYFLIQNDKMRFTMQNSSGNDYPEWVGSTILNASEWYHLVVVWENTTGVQGDVKMYINGQSETIGSYSPLGYSSSFTIGYNSSEPLYIGQRKGGSYKFNGSLDELMIFGRALSSEEVLSLYNSTAYSRNFTSLSQAEYSFKAYSQDENGSINSTETRTVTVVPPNYVFITYPSEYILFQRHNSTTGEIKVYGTYIGIPSAIEASFNGGSWTEIDSSPFGGVFSGSFNASVGQGNLSVRFAGNSSVNDSVVNVSIGDLYVIAGQSNAEGRGTNSQSLNSSNEYLATVYREDDSWTLANDPVDSSGPSSGTPFPLLANYIIQNQSIPVSFISTATGGTSIIVWQKGQNQYNNMYNQINEATNGTMRVKTVLYHQGETDSYPNYGLLGNYSYYKGNLSDFASDFLNDTSVAEKIIVAQVGELASSLEERSRLTADNIRKAQSDSWDENVNISVGPSLYDIGHLSDGVHFKTDSEIQELADRWWASVGKVIYDIGDERGPIINNVTFNDNDNDTIILNFTEDSLPLKIEYWNGTTSSLASGFSFHLSNGTFINNTHISSTEVINQNQLRINLTLNITADANISLGGFNDGVGKPIVRDSSTYSFPAETFYNQTIYMISSDVTPPTITVLSPSNITYSDSTVFFNATANETISMWVVNYNGTNVSSFTINTSLNVEDGFHNLIFYGNDSSGNMGFNNSIYFSVDSTSPQVTISSPTASQSSVTESSLSLSITTNENSTCNYSIDSGTTNSSLTANSTGTGHTGTLSSLTDGDYTLNIYCADIVGNANNTMSVSFIVSIPTTTTPSTSSGGGGGSGTGISTYTVTETQLSQGYSREVRSSSRFKFTIEEGEHYLTLDEVTENTASINVSSIPQFATLSIGDSRRFDVTDDIFYDLRVTLNSVNATTLKANFSLIKINESITADTIAEEQEKESEAEEVENEEETEISFWRKIGNFFEKVWDWIIFWK